MYGWPQELKIFGWGINIVDLGLVYYDVRNANKIDVALTMTAPPVRPVR